MVHSVAFFLQDFRAKFLQERVNKERAPATWCPPNEGCLKINIDGWGKGGWGAVLRD